MTAPSPEQVSRLRKTCRLGQDAVLVEETAEVPKVSSDPLLGDWRLGKAWLARAMRNAVAIK